MAVAGTTAPAAVAPVSPAVLAKIPAEEDFEPQAAATFTVANATAQLAQLENEMSAK